jgi:pyruvate-ferredoxin/flavodoxin oxidoreductase
MIIMGSAANTVEETVDVLNADMGYKVGCLEVKLFRPWPEQAFIDAIPKTCKNIVVMDRTREDGT